MMLRMQVGSIIFLAEWGDRSMLATVALGVSHSPLGMSYHLGIFAMCRC